MKLGSKKTAHQDMLAQEASILRPSDCNNHPQAYSYDLQSHLQERTGGPRARKSAVTHRDTWVTLLSAYDYLNPGLRTRTWELSHEDHPE